MGERGSPNWFLSLGRQVESRLSRSACYVAYLSLDAGKSTLIKMLIHLSEMNEDADETARFPSPVVGSTIQTHMPTSADVHLYADPKTYYDRTPLLYADCEGFDGGGKPPVGTIENRVSMVSTEASLSRLTPGRTRILKWADTRERRNREFVVRQLYPRILYTFSDVVVFVLRNAKYDGSRLPLTPGADILVYRTFESTVLRPLLEWGAASLEKSINQPTLPHAIIVLNSTDLGVPDDEWDIRSATRNLLEANRECLDLDNGHPFFAQLANEWRAKGKCIGTILELIQCYYSTFKVVRIPVKGRFQLMHNQVRKLRGVIADSCDSSFKTKRPNNRLECFRAQTSSICICSQRSVILPIPWISRSTSWRSLCRTIRFQITSVAIYCSSLSPCNHMGVAGKARGFSKSFPTSSLLP